MKQKRQRIKKKIVESALNYYFLRYTQCVGVCRHIYKHNNIQQQNRSQAIQMLFGNISLLK